MRVAVVHNAVVGTDGPDDQDVLVQAETVCKALACWKVFGLRGYGRIDFRIDHDGRPWILEVNANPCLSPDAGFAAALNRAGVRIPFFVRGTLWPPPWLHLLWTHPVYGRQL